MGFLSATRNTTTKHRCDACNLPSDHTNNITLAPWQSKELVILKLCDKCYEEANKKLGEAINK